MRSMNFSRIHLKKFEYSVYPRLSKSPRWFLAIDGWIFLFFRIQMVVRSTNKLKLIMLAIKTLVLDLQVKVQNHCFYAKKITLVKKTTWWNRWNFRSKKKQIIGCLPLFGMDIFGIVDKSMERWTWPYGRNGFMFFLPQTWCRMDKQNGRYSLMWEGPFIMSKIGWIALATFLNPLFPHESAEKIKIIKIFESWEVPHSTSLKMSIFRPLLTYLGQNLTILGPLRPS